MTFAYYTLLIGMFLPIIWVGAAKTGGQRYDNDKPRVFLAHLDGWPQRANWAQMNAYEAFPPYAAGVIVAHLTGNAEQFTIDILAGIWLVARILHGIMYILDKGTLRSLVWTVSFGATVGLFVAAI